MPLQGPVNPGRREAMVELAHTPTRDLNELIALRSDLALEVACVRLASDRSGDQSTATFFGERNCGEHTAAFLQKICRNATNNVPAIRIEAGRVSTQAMSRLRTVLHCRPEPFAAMVPATPEVSTWVVLTGR